MLYEGEFAFNHVQSVCDFSLKCVSLEGDHVNTSRYWISLPFITFNFFMGSTLIEKEPKIVLSYKTAQESIWIITSERDFPLRADYWYSLCLKLMPKTIWFDFQILHHQYILSPCSMQTTALDTMKRKTPQAI